jgi:hypothetical protein
MHSHFLQKRDEKRFCRESVEENESAMMAVFTRCIQNQIEKCEQKENGYS